MKKTSSQLIRQRRVLLAVFVVIFVQALILWSYFDDKSYHADTTGNDQGGVSVMKENSPAIQADSQEKRGKNKGYDYFQGKPAHKSSWCENRKSFVESLSFDPHNRYVSSEIRTPSPLRSCHKGVDFTRRYIPGRSWWSSKNIRRYGGFTADMGWILLVARLALYEKASVEFPSYWGHGCDPSLEQTQRWTCFFEPISRTDCVEVSLVQEKSLLQETEEDRHIAKLYHVYQNPSLFQVRNKPIIEHFINPWFDLNLDNDVQTMRQIFNWVFKLRPEIRARVDRIKLETRKRLKLSPANDFVSIHIRGGDKVGHNAGGPVEAYEIPAEVYAEAISCFYGFSSGTQGKKTVFIASDEYSLVEKIEQTLGDSFTVVTSAERSQQGFSISDYRESDDSLLKFRNAISLWADMELLSESEVFVASFQSNVARMVHLMRLGKATNTTLPVPISSKKQSTCCLQNTEESLLRNCFWLCN